nr:VCBS repeat-containing protein [Nannocystis pusilla]
MAVAATVAACGDEEGRCGPLTRLCAHDGRWQRIAPRVDGAVAVDLDGDGEDEYVVLDRTGELLSVGSGPNGSRSTVFLTGQEPVAIAALPGAVAVALGRPPVLAIFAADESGQLTRRRDIALPDDATALAASDLAGDGAPELVAAVPEAEAIVVIDPETATIHEHPVGRFLLQFAVGDVDGDGHPDVVALDTVAGLLVLRGTGDGGLREAVSNPGSKRPANVGIALADHDGDGDLDAFTRAGPDRVLVHRNNGGGEFSTPIELLLDSWGEGFGLAVGPVADNGLVGVSVPSPEGMATWFGKGSVWLGRIDVALGDASSWIGAGSEGEMLVGGIGYLARWAYRTAGTAIEVWRSGELAGSLGTKVTTGHLDGDHLLDVAVVSDDRLTLLRGRADRGFEPLASLELPSKFRPWALAIADVTGDGRGDVLVSEGPTVWLAQATEDGQYVLHPRYVTKRSPVELVPVRTGPDGRAVMLTSPMTSAVYSPDSGSSVLRFDEAGALIEEIDLVGEDDVFGAAAVDFDEDGVEELLLYRQDATSSYLVHMSPEGDTYVVDGTYDLVALTDATVTFGPLAFAVGDVDGDGQVEVVVAGSLETVVVSGLADGAPVATIGPGIESPRHLRDFDGDGVLDAVTALGSGGLFWYHHGRGDGTFDPEPIAVQFDDGVAIALAAVPDAQFDLVHVSRSEIAAHLMRSVARPVSPGGSVFHGPVDELVLADVDQDGSDDVVTASHGLAGGVGVWWGGEEEPLTRMSVWVPGRSNRGLAVADLDADGDLEALVVDATGEIDAYPFAQRRAGEPIRIAETGTTVQSLAVADVDGDGLPDLVGLLEFSDDMRVMAVARGVAPLQFAEFETAVEFAFNAHSTLELGDVGGDGDLDVLIRSDDGSASALVRADAPGEWAAKVEVLPGIAAMFSPPAADKRVEVVTHDGTSIYRHPEGGAEPRTLLLEGETRVGWLLLGVADVDGNGQYDLVVGDDKGTHVWLRRDDELARVTLCDLPLWGGVAFPDVDGDGRRDLVGLNHNNLFVRRTRP